MATAKTTKSSKVTTKATPVKKTVVQKESPVESKNITTSSPVSSRMRTTALLRAKKREIIIGIIVIALIGLAIYYKGLFVVATVNGEPISRLTFINETESVYIPDAQVTAGKQALNQLVTKTLLFQEAKKRNITVSQKEVDTEVAATRKSLEASGQKLEAALSAQGDTLPAYQERIKIQKLIEKLIGDVAVTDKEVTDYMEKNKDSIPETTDANTVKTQVKETIKQQKYNDKLQTLIQGLQQKAKVSYF